MPYKNWAATDALNAADLNAVTADPVQNEVLVDESKTGGTYGDLTTVGPSVTMTLVSGQSVLVILSCNFNTSIDELEGYAGFAVSGASSKSANDDDAIFYHAVKTGLGTKGSSSRSTVFTATATGSHTFTMKYRSDGTSLLHFKQRRIIVKKF